MKIEMDYIINGWTNLLDMFIVVLSLSTNEYQQP